MRHALVVALVGGAFVAIGPLACSSAESKNPGPAGSMSIAANTSTQFDATYTLGSDWARARVAYTPSTTFYEVTTSQGTTIVRTGTAVDGRTQAPEEDARRHGDVVHLEPSDPEWPATSALLDALVAAGASQSPGKAQVGSTLYAAAYFTAVAIGRVDAARNASVPGTKPSPSMAKTWPYPGYYDKALVPAELRGAAGEQNGDDGVTCCGPYVCYDADWSPYIECDDWCAAGDGCNSWGWDSYSWAYGGGCGTAMFWPPNGCNSCPHSNGIIELSYSANGANDGLCSPRWGSSPGANFDTYGSEFFGYCGGEYGAGCSDYWDW